MNYIPKGGRCLACTKRDNDCSALPFHTMKRLRTDGTDTLVLCDRFERDGDRQEVAFNPPGKRRGGPR